MLVSATGVWLGDLTELGECDLEATVKHLGSFQIILNHASRHVLRQGQYSRDPYYTVPKYLSL